MSRQPSGVQDGLGRRRSATTRSVGTSSMRTHAVQRSRPLCLARIGFLRPRRGDNRASDSRRLYCRDRCHRRGGHRRRRSGLVHPAPGRPTKAPAPLTRFVKGVLSRPHLPRLPSLRMSSCAPRLSPGVAYRRRTQRWRRSRAVARAGNHGPRNNGPKRPASRAQPEAPRCAAPWPLLARHPRRARLSEKQPPY